MSSTAVGYKSGSSQSWRFQGRALYHLSLIHADTARSHIPKHLQNQLVVFPGNVTLGGYYLAHYDDSPAGAFDELVVMAGLVWDGPLSCAWAKRVLVNSTEAYKHGKRTCGLPSGRAKFEHSHEVKTTAWWDAKTPGVLRVTSREGPDRGHKAHIVVPALKDAHKKPAPPIRLAMPSFSGCTPHCPDLLKYALQLKAKVHILPHHREMHAETRQLSKKDASLHPEFMHGRPVVTLLFDRLDMHVDKPARVASQNPKQQAERATFAPLAHLARWRPWPLQRQCTA